TVPRYIGRRNATQTECRDRRTPCSTSWGRKGEHQHDLEYRHRAHVKPGPRFFLLHRMSPLLAQSGHYATEFQCPLLGGKRTLRGHAPMSTFDPKRTLAGCPATASQLQNGINQGYSRAPTG